MVLKTEASILSGTRAQMILPKSSSSLMKKKEMKNTEKSPTPREEAKVVTEPSIDETLEKLSTSLNWSRRKFTRLKSPPREGKMLISQRSSWSRRLL